VKGVEIQWINDQAAVLISSAAMILFCPMARFNAKAETPFCFALCASLPVLLAQASRSEGCARLRSIARSIKIVQHDSMGLTASSRLDLNLTERYCTWPGIPQGQGSAAHLDSAESEHLSRGAAEKLRRKMCGREHRNRGKCRISAAHLISPRSYITRGALVPTLLAPAPVGHCSIQQRPPP
jgi:hypothetical protein